MKETLIFFIKLTNGEPTKKIDFKSLFKNLENHRLSDLHTNSYNILRHPCFQLNICSAPSQPASASQLNHTACQSTLHNSKQGPLLAAGISLHWLSCRQIRSRSLPLFVISNMLFFYAIHLHVFLFIYQKLNASYLSNLSYVIISFDQAIYYTFDNAETCDSNM